MVGEKYWSVGITLRYSLHDKWAARLKFFDDGLCDDRATQGTLATRYFVGLEDAIDILKADAEKLGIEFREPGLCIEGDGKSRDWVPPDNWREILQSQAKRIGWATYGTRSEK